MWKAYTSPNTNVIAPLEFDNSLKKYVNTNFDVLKFLPVEDFEANIVQSLLASYLHVIMRYITIPCNILFRLNHYYNMYICYYKHVLYGTYVIFQAGYIHVYIIQYNSTV